MSILFKTGDIFTSDAPIIGHGTNTEGLMGSGIALQFKKRWPEMHEHYVNMCAEQFRERLVGTAALWIHDYYEAENTVEYQKIIANVFSQDLPGANGNYQWAIKGINQVVNFAMQNNFDSIALPRIACGVAGLNWNVMQVMIFDNFEQFPVDIELWSLPDAK